MRTKIVDLDGGKFEFFADLLWECRRSFPVVKIEIFVVGMGENYGEKKSSNDFEVGDHAQMQCKAK
jgi:hypothetical protein